MRLLFWHVGKHLLIVRTEKYKLDLPRVMTIFCTSVAKVGRLGAENNYCRKTDKQADRNHENLTMDAQSKIIKQGKYPFTQFENSRNDG